jgi:hypothetical protein
VRLGLVAKLLLAAGIVFLLAGLVAFATSSHLAWGERDALSQFQPVECAVLKRQLNWRVKPTQEVPELEDYVMQLQLLVRYEVNGTEVETWVDASPETEIDMWSYLHARSDLEELPTIGDSVTCWYDVNDASTIHLQIGDGGRRTWLIGIALGAFTLMPGLGLIIAAWLLRRLY